MFTRSRKRCGRTLAGIGLLVVALVAGCTLLFNDGPVAKIVVDVLSGESPLVVSFHALDSTDADGQIVSYVWDFGDGETATGATVQHVFVTVQDIETFTITLTVTDDDGATAQMSQTIEVRLGAGGVPGVGFPTARFDAEPWIGVGPVTVAFDASDSTPGLGTIVAYNWNFGDGDEASGAQTTHSFGPDDTTEYEVTLFVWNSQNEVDVEQRTIVVVVPGETTGDDPPVAELTASDPDLIFESEDRPNVPSLFEVTFDPRGSSADAGHQIEYFAWDFGDGDVDLETSDLEVTHIYELRSPSHTYIATLTVFDDQGEQESISLNITLTDAE